MASDSIPPAEASISKTVTDDDLIEALLSALAVDADGADGMTTAELVLATGRSDKWVRRRLWALYRAGKLHRKHAQRQSLSGAIVAVPVYSLAKENPAD